MDNILIGIAAKLYDVECLADLVMSSVETSKEDIVILSPDARCVEILDSCIGGLRMMQKKLQEISDSCLVSEKPAEI